MSDDAQASSTNLPASDGQRSQLVGALSLHVAVRVVEAERERGSRGARGLRAPDLGGAPPHDLRVRPALPSRRARVVAVAVELALRHPRRHHLAGAREVGVPRPPLVRAERAVAHVRERAPARTLLLRNHLSRRGGKVRAPPKRGHAHRRARLVVRRQVLVRRRVAAVGGRTCRRRLGYCIRAAARCQGARAVGRRGAEREEEDEEARRRHGDRKLLAGALALGQRHEIWSGWAE
jgi:hypothetical protein